MHRSRQAKGGRCCCCCQASVDLSSPLARALSTPNLWTRPLSLFTLFTSPPAPSRQGRASVPSGTTPLIEAWTRLATAAEEAGLAQQPTSRPHHHPCAAHHDAAWALVQPLPPRMLPPMAQGAPLQAATCHYPQATAAVVAEALATTAARPTPAPGAWVGLVCHPHHCASLPAWALSVAS